MEASTADIISAMDTQMILPSPMSKEHVLLAIYVLAQFVRTKHSAEALDEINDKLIKQLYGAQLMSQGVDLAQDMIGIQNGPSISLEATILGYPELLDLKYVLLANKTEVDFVTSDNPVVLYNQLFSSQNDSSSTGFSYKGLQIFLPISPKSTLVFYDSNAYTVDIDGSATIDVTLLDDVHELNTLQMCSALNCVYFQDRSTDVELLYRTASQFRRQEKGRLNVFHGDETKDGKEEIIEMSREQIRTNLTLTFIQIKQRMKEWKRKFQKRKIQPVYVDRNKKFHDICQEFIRHAKKNKCDAPKFIQYFKDKNIKYFNQLKENLTR